MASPVFVPPFQGFKGLWSFFTQGGVPLTAGLALGCIIMPFQGEELSWKSEDRIFIPLIAPGGNCSLC